MFKMPGGQPVPHAFTEMQSNYLIQKNDLLQLNVYTNLGEKMIDSSIESLQSGTSESSTTKSPAYLVDNNGVVKFPLIQEIKLVGLTLREAELQLEQEYTKFYQQPYVMLNYTNKRVVVLGAPESQTVPLLNENMRLTEVLALASGLPNDSKAHNIRILRGTEVYIADLSTIDGYKKSNLIMQPDDIVYVEPIRRPISEALRDYGPLVTIVTSLTTLIVVIIGLN